MKCKLVGLLGLSTLGILLCDLRAQERYAAGGWTFWHGYEYGHYEREEESEEERRMKAAIFEVIVDRVREIFREKNKKEGRDRDIEPKSLRDSLIEATQKAFEIERRGRDRVEEPDTSKWGDYPPTPPVAIVPNESMTVAMSFSQASVYRFDETAGGDAFRREVTALRDQVWFQRIGYACDMFPSAWAGTRWTYSQREIDWILSDLGDKAKKEGLRVVYGIWRLPGETWFFSSCRS